MGFPYTEYYQVHSQKLAAIANRVDQLIEESPYKIVAIRNPGEDSPTLLAGMDTPDDISRDYRNEGVELPEAIAEELAETHNNEYMAEAKLNIMGLLGRVSMSFLAEHIETYPQDDGMPWDTPDNPNAPLVPFDEASYVFARFNQMDENLELSATTLKDVNNQPEVTARSHNIKYEDGAIRQCFSLMTFKEIVCKISYKIEPKQDEVLARCIKLLKADIGTVVLLLRGAFSEGELDPTLNEIWAAHQSQSTEEEVGPLLDEVRQRALAAQHALEISLEHEFDLPNISKLQEVERLLDL